MHANARQWTPLLLVGLGACTGLSSELTKTGHTGLDKGAIDTDFDSESADSDDTDPSLPNNAPVADAGEDIDWALETVATLDGSGSFDADEHQLNYQWTFIETPPSSTAVLLNDNRVDPSFYADKLGTFIIELTVDDGVDADHDQVSVTVTSSNLPPVANAGPDQTVEVGNLAQLDGSASSDPDNDPLDYSWQITTRPAGSTALLSGATTYNPRFTPDVEGAFVVELRVSDGDEISSPDAVRIIAAEPSSGGCLSCAGPIQRELGKHASGATLSGAPLLLLFPFTLFIRRRREE